MKTSSYHIVDAQNSKISHLANDEPEFNKVKRNADKTKDKQFLELKSISKYSFYLKILIYRSLLIDPSYVIFKIFSFFWWYDVYFNNIFTNVV